MNAATDSTDATDACLVWQVHPALRRPVAAALAALTIGCLAVLAGLLLQSIGWAVFAATLLVLGQSRFFFPTAYQIDPKGVSAACLGIRKRYLWTEIRRFLHDARGGYLSRRASRSCLDAFCGIHLEFADQRELVVARITESIDRPEHPLEDSQPCDG